MHAIAQDIVDALTFGSLYALYALGVALIFGVMRLVNFAYGELIMAGAYVLFELHRVQVVLLLLATVVIVVVLSLLQDRVAFRPVRNANESTMLVTAFAVSSLLQSIAVLVFGSQPLTVSVLPALTNPIVHGSIPITWLNVATVGATLVLLICLALFLKRTRQGFRMRAAAEDFDMARLLGVRANSVIATAFVLSGIAAATASILLVAESGTVYPQMGSAAILIAFVSTIIGGLGSLEGAVLGGYAFGIVTVILQIVLPVEASPFRDAFAFLVVILFLLLRPQGLVVSRTQAKRI